MSEQSFYNAFALFWTGLAAVVFIVLFFIPAPYGRFARKGWGPKLSHRTGWVLMEAPSALLTALFFALGDRHTNLPALAFLMIWESHYFHRAFIYPFTRRDSKKTMTLVTVLLAVIFNTGNCYLNARALFYLSPQLDNTWFYDPRFILGLALFIVGYIANKRADATLRALRRQGAAEYGIPRGGLFERVSAANYFGELVEWTGWAVLTWSVGGLVFALWTAANLIPRAHTIHRWYKETFPEYPQNRKAVLPFVF